MLNRPRRHMQIRDCFIGQGNFDDSRRYRFGKACARKLNAEIIELNNNHRFIEVFNSVKLIVRNCQVVRQRIKKGKPEDFPLNKSELLPKN